MTTTSDDWRQWGAIGPLLEKGFSIIPNVILRDRALSGAAKLCWALIYDYIHRREDPQMGELQADLGLSEKPTRAALKELETAGFLKRKRNGLGLPNSYWLTVPEALILPSDGSGTASGAAPSSKDLREHDDVGAEAPTSGDAGLVKARKRNPVFDALVEATAANPADGGMIGKAAKAIRTAMEDTLRDLREGYLANNPQESEVPADVIDELVAGQIRIRAEMYQRLRPEWELTPTALAKHWNRIPTWQPKGMRPADIAKLRDEDFGVDGTR